MNFEFEAGRVTAKPDGMARSPAALSNVDDAAPAVGGATMDAEEGPRNESRASVVATVPTLLVYLDENGILHWKPDDVKGARWRCSKSDSIGVVCRQADEVMPDRYEIGYVSEKS